MSVNFFDKRMWGILNKWTHQPRCTYQHWVSDEWGDRTDKREDGADKQGDRTDKQGDRIYKQEDRIEEWETTEEQGDQTDKAGLLGITAQGIWLQMLSCFEEHHQYQKNEKETKLTPSSKLIYWLLRPVRWTYSSLLTLIGAIAVPTVPRAGVLGVWSANYCKKLEQHTLLTCRYSPEYGDMQPHCNPWCASRNSHFLYICPKMHLLLQSTLHFSWFTLPWSHNHIPPR